MTLANRFVSLEDNSVCESPRADMQLPKLTRVSARIALGGYSVRTECQPPGRDVGECPPPSATITEWSHYSTIGA